MFDDLIALRMGITTYKLRHMNYDVVMIYLIIDQYIRKNQSTGVR